MSESFDFEQDGKNYRFSVFVDESPENPRHWDNLGTIVTFHGEYRFRRDYPEGDEQEYRFDFEEEIKTGERRAALWFPLWSGSCGLHIGKQEETDDSIVGYVSCERATLLKEYGAKLLHKALKEKIYKVFECELEAYNAYCNGEVYGYSLKEITYCETCKREEREHIDSCCGFYGDNMRDNGLFDSVPSEFREAIRESINA